MQSEMMTNNSLELAIYDHHTLPQETGTSSAWKAAQTVGGLSERELNQHNALIAMELYRLRTAYPTQTRNYTEQEVQAINALWSEIFGGVDPRLLHEAVMRFMINDKKAFFPAPGQIVGCIEQIVLERQAEENRIHEQQERERWRKHQERISNGENCSTCRFCERRRQKLEGERLYCQNPKSYKYEGEYGHGTVADILCDEYEPQENAAALPPRRDE